MDELIMSTGGGKLYIHRDIPGDHGGCDCWCDPIEIPEDTLQTPLEVVSEVSVKEFRH